MESSKKYEYILEQPEIREFCFYAFLEQFRYSKRAGLKIILLFVLCLIIMPRIAVWFAVLIVAMLLLSIVRTYTNIGKSISGQQWTVWLEGGMLKVDRGGSSEVSCSNIKLIRTTRRLLMLGYLKTEQRPAWIIVPLRMFAEVQERESFLDRIRHPQEIEGNDTEEEAEGICLTYTLDEMRWVDFRKGAVSIITSGTFGRKKRVRAVLLFGLWMMISMLVCLYLVEGYFSWVSASYGLGIAVLVTVRFFFRDPEKSFRKQIKKPAIRDRECGVWQIMLSESGVCVRTPEGMRNNHAWEKFEWLVETGDAFYIFYKDKKNYEVIAKESFQDWNQVSAMHELCARKGVKPIQGRKMHYLPDWGFVLLVVLYVILCVGIIFMSVFWSSMKENRGQRHRAAQEQREMHYQEDVY